MIICGDPDRAPQGKLVILQPVWNNGRNSRRCDRPIRARYPRRVLKETGPNALPPKHRTRGDKMKDVEIRRATLDDAQGICRLNREDLGYTYDPVKTENRLRFLMGRPDHRVLVAVLDSQIAGYIHACSYDLLYADPMKNIMGIAVKDAFRRRGVGKALLEAVESWARQDGAAGVRLASGSDRKAAHRFYLSCGYTKNKEKLNFSKVFPLDRQ